MAKILVADDNSNVQKTVGLALADLGVEVIAVNNGDAAVRKLPDILPDLVLADIFMPVRNGYEVCEYVKKDTRFSHVPVVLLVGAFDPLDEREAQRVGADGILKKPFVPPDPLIAMVKTLLDRTIVDRLVTVGASKPAVAAQAKGGGVATAEQPPASRISSSPATSAEEISEQAPEEEFHPSVDRVSFGEGDHPVAFEQFLGTQSTGSSSDGSGTGVIEPVDDEQILTSSRDASLGDPIFWRTEAPSAEEGAEEENSEPESGRDVSPELAMPPWKLDHDILPGPVETDLVPPVEPPLEIVRDDVAEAMNESPTIAKPGSLIAQDAASQASLTVEDGKAPDLAANPIEWMATAPAPPVESTVEDKPAADAAENLTEAEPELSEPAYTVPVQAAESEDFSLEPAEAETPAPARPEASVLSSGTALPPMPSSSAISPPSTLSAHAETVAASAHENDSDPDKTQPHLTPLNQSAEDTARSIPKQQWADLAASLEIKPVEPAAEKPKAVSYPVAAASSFPAVGASHPTESNAVGSHPIASSPAAPSELTPVATTPASAVPAPATPQATTSNSAGEPHPAPDPALVEAVVQRVLEKMRPQVVDIITKEFLRPVVQALVHREIQKR